MRAEGPQIELVLSVSNMNNPLFGPVILVVAMVAPTLVVPPDSYVTEGFPMVEIPRPQPNSPPRLIFGMIKYSTPKKPLKPSVNSVPYFLSVILAPFLSTPCMGGFFYNVVGSRD